jgi:hypothetical protein
MWCRNGKSSRSRSHHGTSLRHDRLSTHSGGGGYWRDHARRLPIDKSGHFAWEGSVTSATSIPIGAAGRVY